MVDLPAGATLRPPFFPVSALLVRLTPTFGSAATQGISMEPHGTRQGGYSDGYGDENLGMMLGPLCNITGDAAICRKAQAVSEAASVQRRPCPLGV